MKIHTSLKKFMCFSLSTLLITTSAVGASAATTRSYKFSALNTQVDIPSDMAVFTRNVTSADPNLDLIDASADEVRVTFEQHGIYLEAFPNDVSYEVVLSGQAAADTDGDFDTLSSSRLNEKFQDYKALCESVETDDITDASIYKNNTTSFYMVDSKSISNGITVYIRKYYTIMQGNEISLTIQSNGSKLTDEQTELIKNIVDSAKFMEISASITESPIFTELFGTISGIVITIAILGTIVFFANKSTKKRKK